MYSWIMYIEKYSYVDEINISQVEGASNILSLRISLWVSLGYVYNWPGGKSAKSWAWYGLFCHLKLSADFFLLPCRSVSSYQMGHSHSQLHVSLYTFPFSSFPSLPCCVSSSPNPGVFYKVFFFNPGPRHLYQSFCLLISACLHHHWTNYLAWHVSCGWAL